MSFKASLQVSNHHGEVELVAGAGQPSEPHALEAVMGLHGCEAHLDALALIACFEERLSVHLAARHVASILVDITRDLSGRTWL
jgi:hypothetical protein